MSDCPIEMIDAAVDDKLTDQETESLQSHLSSCDSCRKRLENAAAAPTWWCDVQRLLDIAALDDPSADVADSSTADARLFEADDPVSELKAAGVIDSPSHPEMLGKLGRYSIEREIGTGGMGVVLKGYDGELNRTVAIKVLAPHLARSGAARQRFVREGRAAAAVVHENVVAIHEVDSSGRLPTLVMRYVDGVSLQRRVDTVGPLPICDALRIAAQTAAGLAAAHRQGIVHRDVKPANIIVNAAGQRAWITDFGLARAVDDASLTRTGFIAGTPHYMSPEQARGGTVGPASDLFSLGGVLYFMLAARPPWRAERSLAVLHRIVQEAHRPIWKLNPEVPREVSDLVDALLSKAPEHRGASALEVQQKLESILSNLQNPAGPHSLSSTSQKATSKSKPSLLARPLVLIPMTVAFTVLAMNSPALINQWRPDPITEANEPGEDVAISIDQGSVFAQPFPLAVSRDHTRTARSAGRSIGNPEPPRRLQSNSRSPIAITGNDARQSNARTFPTLPTDVRTPSAGVTNSQPRPSLKSFTDTSSGLSLPSSDNSFAPLEQHATVRQPPPSNAGGSTISESLWMEILHLEAMLLDAESVIDVSSPNDLIELSTY